MARKASFDVSRCGLAGITTKNGTEVSAFLFAAPLVPSVYAFAPLKLRRTRFALAVSAWLRHA